MFQPGDVVRLLSPFDVAIPGTFVVDSVRVLDDGSTAVRLDSGADFDPQYLEKV